MRGRVALAAAMLVLGLQAVAVAQTTTSTTASSTTSTTTGPTTSTTATTMFVARRPPDAFVAGTSGEVKADTESFCWGPPPGTTGPGLCADSLFEPPVEALVVTQGEQLTVRFASSGAPTQLTVRQFVRGASSPELAVSGANPARFPADLPLGTVGVAIFSVWAQGDASYLVTLDVRAPARGGEPPERPVRFTG